MSTIVIQLPSDFSSKSKDDTAPEIRRIPEIHILLTKDIKNTTELG